MAQLIPGHAKFHKMNAHTISFYSRASPDYQPFYNTPLPKPPPVPSGQSENQPPSFAALAHEIRNPLTNINLATEMLRAAIKDNESIGYLDIIGRSSVRINLLLTELLRHHELKEMMARTCSIQQLLDEVLEMTRDRIALKQIMVRKDYAARDCQVEMNRPNMKIALTNIIINAIDAMFPGKGTLKLATYSIDGKYIIRIEDNGCGISRANLNRIFKPYYTNKPGGLGLGLSTTHEILTSNHVEVQVRSKEGRGTCFILFMEKDSSN